MTWGRGKQRMAEMTTGDTFYFSLLFPALYSGPFISAFYFSLLFHPSPAEEAQQEDGAAETELDAHGGPDALEAERGG